jgi:hypothetical protein
VGLPPALLPAPDRSQVTVRSGRLQGGLDNNAARNPPACLTDRSPARRVRGVEYRNLAGTLVDEHARRSVPAVKSALVAAPFGRSQRGVGRWHRGQAPAQQASRICSSPSSCHSVRPTPPVPGGGATSTERSASLGRSSTCSSPLGEMPRPPTGSSSGPLARPRSVPARSLLITRRCT